MSGRNTLNSSRDYSNYLDLCRQQSANLEMCKKNDWDVPVLEKPDPASLANIVQKEQKSKDTKKKWRNRGILAGLACMVVLAVALFGYNLWRKGKIQMDYISA